MFCGKCGTKMEDGSQFCGNCGTSVDFDSAPQQQNEYIAPTANTQQNNTQTNYVPPQANYAAPTNQPQAGEKTLASKGLTFSIISLVGSLIATAPVPVFRDIAALSSFFFGIAGIVLSATALIRAKKAGQPDSMAIVALILGALGILFCFIADGLK